MTLHFAIDACPALASIAMQEEHEVYELPENFGYAVAPWVPNVVWVQLDHMIYGDKHAGRFRYRDGRPNGPAVAADAHLHSILQYWKMSWSKAGCLLFVVGGPSSAKTVRPVIGKLLHRQTVIGDTQHHVWSGHGWQPGPEYLVPSMFHDAALQHAEEYLSRR